MSRPDIYLRAESDAAMLAVLTAAGLTAPDDDGNEQPVGATQRHQLVIIGPLSEPTGATDDDGEPIMAPVPGYHANLLTNDAEIIAAVASITIDPPPVTPAVRWQLGEQGAP